MQGQEGTKKQRNEVGIEQVSEGVRAASTRTTMENCSDLGGKFAGEIKQSRGERQRVTLFGVNVTVNHRKHVCVQVPEAKVQELSHSTPNAQPTGRIRETMNSSRMPATFVTNCKC